MYTKPNRNKHEYELQYVVGEIEGPIWDERENENRTKKKRTNYLNNQTINK